MQQLAAGMLEMWRHNVVHRDLKPQNLLLFEAEDGSMEVKIADFGFARALGPEKMAETLCGSPLYMAPEILTGHQYDAKADLWSIGAILFEMVCCCKIYEYNEMKDSVYLIGVCRFVGSLHMEGQIRWPC
jgi:serine/threonine-protein kinase ULK/ATG1